jgi:hypothetical protein
MDDWEAGQSESRTLPHCFLRAGVSDEKWRNILLPKNNLGLDCICPTPLVKIFADMKSCEQIWLVTGAFAIYQWLLYSSSRGNV